MVFWYSRAAAGDRAASALYAASERLYPASCAGYWTSRRYSICASVSRRPVEPGLPITNTSSFSAAPAALHLK